MFLKRIYTSFLLVLPTGSILTVSELETIFGWTFSLAAKRLNKLFDWINEEVFR